MMRTRTVAWDSIWIILATVILANPSWAQAFEPLHCDITQTSMAEANPRIDHLQPLPLGRPVPEFDYLAQYYGIISKDAFHYVVVVRNKLSGKCFVQQGKPPTTELHGGPYQFKQQAEISADTASLIYDYWINMLVETRYDSKRLPFLLGGTFYSFSTFALGIGYMHGYTRTGISPDTPPYWMSQAGEALFEFATKSHNQEQLRARIKEHRDKFYEFMKRKEAEESESQKGARVGLH